MGEIDSRWLNGQFVLSAKGFPSSTALRYKEGRLTGRSISACTCGKYASHRDALDLLKEVAVPWFRETFAGRGPAFPEVEVCFNSRNIWSDQIPRLLSGAEKDCKFVELANIEQCENALLNCTYWYRRLRGNKKRRSGASVALLRILGGYKGFSHNRGNNENDSVVLFSPPNEGGMNKLRNILATVDGLLVQLMLSFPETEKMQSWKTYDQITHCVISNLIPDYASGKTGSAYAALKMIRKGIKREGFDPLGSAANVTGLRRFSFFVPLLQLLGDVKSPWNMVKVSLLSQTRAAGVPPPAIKREALEKWVTCVTQKSDPRQAEHLAPAIVQAVDDMYDEMVAHKDEEQLETFFRKVLRSAKISLSDSAELSVPVLDGGKLEAARRRISSLGRVKEIDLETGLDTGKYFTAEVGGIGEMLFHDTLARWRDGPYKDDKMSIRVSVVSELGKYRTITVSSHDHAILLHPMSHMTLEFFAELPSAAAGVRSSNQAWEFFRRLSGSNPAAGFLFDKEHKKSVLSTDWETATDYCDHYIARAMMNRFLERIGLPSFYRKLCIFALTAPRKVLSPLNDEGKPWLTSRAVLMGDPGTKSLLTLYHPVVKYIAMRAIKEFSDIESDNESSQDSEDD